MKKRILYLVLLLSSLLAFHFGTGYAAKNKTAAKTAAAKQVTQPLKVGFDVDDTLLFSSPAFEQGFKSGAKGFSKEFWEVVNMSDRKYSGVKKKTESIVKDLLKSGSEVYVITARESHKGEGLKDFLHDRMGIKKENIYFASKGKAELMKKLGITVFYGDSDSDISDAQAAGAKGIRIQRSEKSSYKNKYNPGSLGEEIVQDSAE